MCIGHYNENHGCGHTFLAVTEICSVAEDGWECEVWQRRQERLYHEKCDECRKRDDKQDEQQDQREEKREGNEGKKMRLRRLGSRRTRLVASHEDIEVQNERYFGYGKLSTD